MRKIIYIFLLFCFFSCKKFLDAKNDKTITTPETLDDLVGLLNNTVVINRNDVAYGLSSSDDYYLTLARYNTLSSSQQNLYYWGPDVFLGAVNPTPWAKAYGVINVSNICLETLPSIQRTSFNASEYDNVAGTALFNRGYFFWKIAVTWSKSYNEDTYEKDLGIPLRLNSNFNEVSVRSSVKETYQQILRDVQMSIPLLPVKSEVVERPSKVAAYGLMARIYLSMNKYDQALVYADSCLKEYSILMDYNELNASSTNPIPLFNKEIIVYFSAIPMGSIVPSRIAIDTSLYASYDSTDLRRKVFFNYQPTDGTYSFKGSYGASGSFFSGIATDEMFLTRAECYARGGNVGKALEDLNTLLENRYNTGTFMRISTGTAKDILEKILLERRKELAFRDLRWMDIKRLNILDPSISLKRIIGSTSYELTPNDNRFALPIPNVDISLSNMQQNPR